MRPLVELRARIEWQPADESVVADELRTTSARLELWAGEDCVTLVEDPANSSIRRSIFVSLYPLAEWIAYSWWRLQFDGRPLIAGPRAPWPSHTTTAAGDGFCWPDCALVPEGDLMRLRWRPPHLQAGSPLRFLSHGTAWADGAQVMAVLGSIVEAVIGRLSESGLADTGLQKEWDVLHSLDGEESDFCRAAARLGVDPFSDGVELAEQIESVFAVVGSDLGHDLLDAAVLGDLSADARWVQEQLAVLRRRPPGGEALLDRLRLSLAPIASTAGQPPWEIGWSAARRVRDEFGLMPTQPWTFATGGAIPVSELDDRGVVAAGMDSAMILARDLGHRARRFAEGRALWHAMSSESGSPYLLTRATSTTQAIGRAFAAELLVPAQGIHALVRQDIGDDDIGRIGDNFDAPEQVVSHQIENQLA